MSTAAPAGLRNVRPSGKFRQMARDEVPLSALRDRLRGYHEADPRETMARLARTIAPLVVIWPLLFIPAGPLAARVGLAVLVGGLLLRCCSFGHDWAHGATLRGSKLGRWLVHGIGLVVLAPVRIWADTHNAHHAHNSLLRHPAVGSFPLWTLDEYRSARRLARAIYRFARSPLMMLLAWPIMFVLALNLVPGVRDPRRYASSLLALAIHAGLNALALALGGISTWAVAMALPYTLLGASGAYLFYVQHNFPGARWHEPDTWSPAAAALASSSFMAMPGLLHWFTGSIGYHHIHHLDARVPFYRLPEAYAAEPELRRPPDTSWRPADVRCALRLGLWDEASGRILPWREVADR